MRRALRRLLIATILTVAYILTQSQPTHEELTIHPAWAVVPSAAPLHSDQGNAVIPFILIDEFGYVDDAGRLLYRGTRSHGTTMSAEAFSNYPRVPDPVVIQDRSGNLSTVLPTQAYPAYLGDRLFAVGTEGTRFSEWSSTGERLWVVDLPTPVTSLAAGDSIAVAGLLAGGIEVIGADGAVIPLVNPGGTQDRVTLSVAASGRGTYIGVLSGGARPALSLFRHDGSRVTPLVDLTLDATLPAEPLISFALDESTLYFQSADGVVALNLDDGHESLFPSAMPARAVTAAGGTISALLFSGEQREPSMGFLYPAEFAIAASGGIVPIRQRFAAEKVTLLADDGLLILAIDNRLIAFRVETG